MSKTLYLMVGPAGAGKSTWAKNHSATCGDSYKIVTLSVGTDGFYSYISNLNQALYENSVVYADASHLTEHSRNKVLNNLELMNVDIIPVVIYPSVETCLAQNAKRSGHCRLSDWNIKRIYSKMRPPTHEEKYRYAAIVTVKE